MSDERYDRSADMRLLELKRKEMGIEPHVLRSTGYTDPDSIADLPDDEDLPTARGTMLVAHFDAQPRTNLIAGALVTLSLSVVNDGGIVARNVRTSLPLPENTLYRHSSFVVDGLTADDERAADVFGNGTELGDIEPGARRTLMIKIVIEAGLGDIIFAPHLSAASGAILGLRAVRLTRATQGAAGGVVERAFYELGEDEEPRAAWGDVPAEYPPIPQPLSAPAQRPQATPEAATKTIVPTIRGGTRKPTRKPKAEPAVPAPTAPPEPSQPKGKAEKTKAKTKAKGKPVAVAVAVDPIVAKVMPKRLEVLRFDGRGGPLLTVRVDRKRLAALARLFSGPSHGMIAHYLVLNALATTDALPGDGDDRSIAGFVLQQEQLLSRALITTRLGKPPASNSLAATLPPFPPAIAHRADSVTITGSPPGEALLVRAFEAREIVFLERVLSNPKAPPFLRAAQLFVGMCANDVAVASEHHRRSVSSALTTYAILATTEISRIFLRAKLTGTPALFKETEPDFDDAARHVLHQLGKLDA